MLTSWWMLDGTFGQTGPDVGERVDGTETETETGGGAFVPVCPQRAGALISSSRDDVAEIAVDCHAALPRARHLGVGPDSFCSLFVHLSISVTSPISSSDVPMFPCQQQSPASSWPQQQHFQSVTSAARVTLAGWQTTRVLAGVCSRQGQGRQRNRGPSSDLAGPRQAKGGGTCWPSLSTLSHPPVCHHQPQNQAIGAANQQLGRAASPTTTPGQRQHKPRQHARRRDSPAARALPSLSGPSLGTEAASWQHGSVGW